MTIKSEKILWKYILIAFVAILLLGIICITDGMFVFMMCGLSFYVLICTAISLGKTIILDEKGCTLCFWKYKKIYRWEEFKIKRMEDYRNIYRSSTDQIPFSSVVFFSTKKLHKPDIMQFFTYNIFLRPFSFSFFYFYFKVEDMHWGGYLVPYPEIYPVDEKEFLEKMQEWGVELEVHTSRGEQYK